MITEKFDDLITHLASCNGTCMEELQKRIDDGDLSEEEASYVYIYTLLRKLHTRVDNMVVRVL